MNKYVDAKWLKDQLGGINMDIRTDEVKKYIDSAPSIEVNRPQGENVLKEYKSLFECSVCGASCDDTYPWDCDIRFCPNCGAKMKGEDDE